MQALVIVAMTLSAALQQNPPIVVSNGQQQIRRQFQGPLSIEVTNLGVLTGELIVANGDLTLKVRKSKVILVGRCDRLILDIDEQGAVDLSRFNAGEVKITKINGQSKLRFRQIGPQRAAVFSTEVDGQSEVVISADGDVTFERKIDGQSKVCVQTNRAVTGGEVSGASNVYWMCPAAPVFTNVGNGSSSTQSACPPTIAVITR